jgi:RND family efflux transporter MFP subunit
MFRPTRVASVAVLSCVIAAGRIGAADGPPFDRGPAKVVGATGALGVLAPQGEFRGSVYFAEVSDVATEVRGKVLEVLFDEGEHVSKDQVLARLDDELVRKELGALKARLERDRTVLKNGEVRLGRLEGLVAQGLSPAEEFDQTRFDVQALRYSVAASEAEVERMQTVISKSAIHAPFDGIVIDRPIDIGEWTSEGDTIAVLARSGAYEVVVNVPEASMPYATPGLSVELQTGSEKLTGQIAAIIPRGDVATRTFPVKLRVDSLRPLMEGMSALARMPVGERIDCLIVPRDAVLNQQGEFFVFTIQDGIAHRHTVSVLGFQDRTAGIDAPELGPGQVFAISGHERLKDGDRVDVTHVDSSGDAPARATGS